jgi:hypothetical protein
MDMGWWVWAWFISMDQCIKKLAVQESNSIVFLPPSRTLSSLSKLRRRRLSSPMSQEISGAKTLKYTRLTTRNKPLHSDFSPFYDSTLIFTDSNSKTHKHMDIDRERNAKEFLTFPVCNSLQILFVIPIPSFFSVTN